MRIIDLGLLGHAEAEALQLETLEAVRAGEENTLFLLEHPPVITLGHQGGLENLHVSEEFLRARGVALRQIGRGGNITCHFPGQLVGYPVFRVERRPGGIRRFFEDMEEAVIRTCRDFGVPAARVEGRPGAWVDGRKICSMGIGVRHWITFHGLALNVARDLALFDLITLCGLAGARPTSLSLETGRDIPMKDVKDALAGHFRQVFPDSALAARQPAA
jgi:lipoyl(octanoyl) transferase